MEEKPRVTVTIRRATPRDFVNIMRMCDAMLAENESAFQYPAIDDTKLMQTIMDCHKHGTILVADCTGQIVGMLALFAREWPWSYQRVVTNELFHVLPKFRKRGTADALLKAAESFANNAKVPLMIAFSGGKNAELKDRLMQMKGYTYCGGMFHRPVFS